MNLAAPPVAERRAIGEGVRESRWQAADGLAIRRIDWPAPSGKAPTGTAKGAILFLPGRGDFYEKYLETLAHWAADGWQVTASDWRGQGDSGRLGLNATTGHIDDFATWVDDLAGFWQRWKAETPGPHVLAGHSMGGHLVLRALAEGRVDPDGAMLSAPMLGFTAQPLPQAAMHWVAKLMTKLGDPRRPAWKWSEQPGAVPAARIHLLTHDAERYADELWWREHRPQLVMEPGSWGWVERAYASMRLLAAPGVLERVQVPVLMFGTDTDKLVAWNAMAKAATRLGDCELLHFGIEAHHEILRESDAVRGRALAACDAFLARIAAS